MTSSSNQDLISAFEDEQKTLVFTALSDYLHLSLFTDVTLVSGTLAPGIRNVQHFRAHKIVLSSSSKFFRDLFQRNPQLQSVDLDKELAQNDLFLSFEDVQLIIGILYCVGTVEISPQRIESLLVAAQVLGIPTLIRFLKRIKGSIDSQKVDRLCHSFIPYPSFPTSSAMMPTSTPVPSTSFHFQPLAVPGLLKRQQSNDSQSRSRQSNFDTFSLQTTPVSHSRPETTQTQPTAISSSSRAVNIGLESFDPSFLNNLQANQIDDLENALLPHLQSNEDDQTDSQPDHHDEETNGSTTQDTRISNNTAANEPIETSSAAPATFTAQLFPFGNESFEADPVIIRPNKSPQPVERQSSPAKALKTITNPGPTNPTDDESSRPGDRGNEIEVNLQSAEDSGKSFKFAIPGSSKSVTLNFSADALKEMQNSMSKKTDQENNSQQEVSSSTEVATRKDLPSERIKKRLRKRKSLPSKPKKTHFKCHKCSKGFMTKSLLDRHYTFHFDTVSACKECDQVFGKRWLLEQHQAIVHGNQEAIKCDECDKEFKWARNLLAHMQLVHPKEQRYRCKNCPLTFLQRRTYINHQVSKHPEKSPTWCLDCKDVFDSRKDQEEHDCPLFENTGNSLICHRHEAAKVYYHQADFEKHFATHDDHDKVVIPKLTCPVCQKKFLFRKNLNGHMRRFHEDERKKAEFACKVCKKVFFFRKDCAEHENTHDKDAQHTCQCGKSYSSKKALLQHQKLHHISSAVHKCQICHKVLSNQYKLKYHMSVHSDNRDYKCNYCDTYFKAKDNLMKHMTAFHTKTDD